jgi:hypothetical protein
MTDDIVTRLREEYDYLFSEWQIVATVLPNATDEIERLRKDCRELLQIAKLFYDYGQCQNADEYGDCIHLDGVCEWHSSEHLWESFCMSRGL